SAITSSANGGKCNIWQRDFMVLIICPSSSVMRMKTVLLGGSSISFKSLLAQAVFIFSAIQIIITLYPPSYAFNDKDFTISLASSTPICPCLLSTPSKLYQSNKLPYGCSLINRRHSSK